jgi:hypothetical protein
MIYIIDLFVQFLYLFYEVNYRSLDCVDSLVHGAIYRELEQYYSVGFSVSVDKSAGIQILWLIYIYTTEWHHCVPA